MLLTQCCVLFFSCFKCHYFTCSSIIFVLILLIKLHIFYLYYLFKLFHSSFNSWFLICIFFVKMYILHLLEKTSPPFILYFDFTVRTTGPLKVPEDSVCFHWACFRKELTSSKIDRKMHVFLITALYSFMYHYYKNSVISRLYVSCLWYKQNY